MVGMNERNAARDATALIASPVEVATQALSFALEFCRTRVADGEDPVALLKNEDAEAHEYLRYGLALRLADYLGTLDPTLKAAYVCKWDDPAEEVESTAAGLTSPLSLALWVDRKTAALGSLLADLDASLTREYRALVAPKADKLRSLLDANVVDDRDIRERTGYGAIITSLRERPLKVWQR